MTNGEEKSAKRIGKLRSGAEKVKKKMMKVCALYGALTDRLSPDNLATDKKVKKAVLAFDVAVRKLAESSAKLEDLV